MYQITTFLILSYFYFIYLFTFFISLLSLYFYKIKNFLFMKDHTIFLKTIFHI